MDLTIPEAVLLLALDDERGSPLVDDSTLGLTLAGAAAAQLLLDGRMRVAGEGEPGARAGRLVPAGGATDPRLEPLVDVVAGSTPKQALTRIAGWGGSSAPTTKVRARLLDDFAAAGVLVRDEDRFLGLRWRERWERGARRDVEDALQARAREVLAGADDPVVGAALAILHGADALPKVFPDLPKGDVVARGTALATGSWASEEVRRAIESVQVAMTAALMVPIITSSSGS